MSQKQLGQTQTAAGTATSIYSPAAGVETSNMTLTCVNTTASADTLRVYQDHDGTTYSAATALYFDLQIAAKATLRLGIGPMNEDAGNIAVSSATANAVTFTLHGMESLK